MPKRTLLFLAAISFMLVVQIMQARTPDEPYVRDFSIVPAITVPGEPVILKWKIEAAESSNPVVKIRINAFLQTLYNGSELTGERKVTIPLNTSAPSDQRIELQMTTKDGKVFSRYIGCQLLSLDMVKRSLALEQVPMQYPQGAGAAPVLRIRIKNQALVKLSNVELRVLQADDAESVSAALLYDQSGMTLNPGVNEYNLNMNGYDANENKSVHVVMLYGNAMPKIELKIFTLTMDSK